MPLQARAPRSFARSTSSAAHAQELICTLFKGTLAQARETVPDLPAISDVSHPEYQQILVGQNGSSQHFFRPLPPEILRELRYDGTKGPRGLKLTEDGKLENHIGLDGVFRLTPESADELATIRWI
jgi:hypothetical protein